MPQQRELLARYQHLRQVAMRLNHRLVETLSKSILDEGGQKLGILKKNVLVFDSEDEMAVLMDFCIYDVRREEKNAVERYLVESPPSPGSDEMILLEAMTQARYCLLAVEAAEPGVGVHVRDLLRDEPLFVTDVGFSRSAVPGFVLAGRVVAADGIVMTTGAALPVDLPPAHRNAFLAQLATALGVEHFRDLAPEQASKLALTVIRGCLRQGAAEHIQYLEPGQAHPAGRPPVASATPRRIGRNDPCPCGSGKKYKKCCGARR